MRTNIIEYSKGNSFIDINEYNIRLSLERGKNNKYDAQINVLDSFKEKYKISYREVSHEKK